MLNEKLLVLHLSLIDGVGPCTIKLILEKKPTNFSLDDFYIFKSSDFQNIFGITAKLAEKIVNGLNDKQILNNELQLIEKNKICWLTVLDDEYPFLLKNIYNPPPTLYIQGQKIIDSQKRIAIIGSRKADNYGYKVIKDLVTLLVQNNWSIVSGGAIGADTMAHKLTLEAGGNTIVILGSGLLKPYPDSNKKLFDQILSNNGTIVSSFPLNMAALPANFPSRNRIISGLSQGCIVVQAGIKSGTRITALCALEQGREVFAIPGPIDNALSAGCHKLIQEGAKLVTSGDDILQEFGEKTDVTIISKPKLITEKKEKIETIEEKIISICNQPCSLQELSDSLSLDMMQIQIKLFDLQLEGKIKQNFAGMWEKSDS